MTTYTCDHCGMKTDDEDKIYLQKVVHVHLGACGDYCLDCYRLLADFASKKFLEALDELKRMFEKKCAAFKCRNEFFGRETVENTNRLVVDYKKLFEKE